MLTAAEFGLIAVAVVASGIIQGSIGFGFSFVAVPVFTVVAPEALPATAILLGLPMAGYMAFKEREAINVPTFVYLSLGRLPGTAIGALLLVLVPAARLSTLFGCMLIGAVAVSALGPDVRPRRRTFLAAGLMSGLMGTAAALGGPPLGLAMQGQSAGALRATLGMTFSVGVCVSVGALAVTGHVTVEHLLLAALLLPAIALGITLSSITRKLLGQNWLRPAVLSFAALAGLGTTVQGLSRSW